MDQREQRIAERLSAAEAREETANAEAVRFEAERRRSQLIEAARTEVAEMRKHWHRQVEDEKEAFKQIEELKTLTSGLLDQIPVDRIFDAEMAIRRRVVDERPALCADIENSAKLDDAEWQSKRISSFLAPRPRSLRPCSRSC